MNLADLRRNLTQNIGNERATDLHTEAARDDVLNQAYSDITNELDVLQANYSPVITTQPDGTRTFTLPAGFNLSAILQTSGDKLIQVSREAMSEMQSAAGDAGLGPGYFYVESGTVTLSRQSLYEPLRVRVMLDAPRMTQPTDEPWAGQYKDFHKLIHILATSYLYRQKAGDQGAMQASRFWLSEYEREKNLLIKRLNSERPSVTILAISTATRQGRRRRGWMDE